MKEESLFFHKEAIQIWLKRFHLEEFEQNKRTRIKKLSLMFGKIH